MPIFWEYIFQNNLDEIKNHLDSQPDGQREKLLEFTCMATGYQLSTGCTFKTAGADQSYARLLSRS